MDAATVSKLEYAFSLGCTDEEACFHADITKMTLYRYCDKHPSFSDRKEVLKQNPVFKARKVLLDALDSNDVNTAHKFVERKDGTAKQRVETSGVDGAPINHKLEWTINIVRPKPQGD